MPRKLSELYYHFEVYKNTCHFQDLFLSSFYLTSLENGLFHFFFVVKHPLKPTVKKPLEELVKLVSICKNSKPFPVGWLSELPGVSIKSQIKEEEMNLYKQHEL